MGAVLGISILFAVRLRLKDVFSHFSLQGTDLSGDVNIQLGAAGDRFGASLGNAEGV